MIYTKKLKTITLKVKEEPASETASNSRSAYEIANSIYRNLSDDQEHFCVLFLNGANKVTGFKVLFSGGMNAATVDLKVVFRNALLFGARSLILVHNHPSSTLTASQEDIRITQETKYKNVPDHLTNHYKFLLQPHKLICYCLHLLVQALLLLSA